MLKPFREALRTLSEDEQRTFIMAKARSLALMQQRESAPAKEEGTEDKEGEEEEWVLTGEEGSKAPPQHESELGYGPPSCPLSLLTPASG